MLLTPPPGAACARSRVIDITYLCYIEYNKNLRAQGHTLSWLTSSTVWLAGRAARERARVHDSAFRFTGATP